MISPTTRRAASAPARSTPPPQSARWPTAFADRDQTTLNFGLAQFTTDFTAVRTIRIRNDAATEVTFDVAVSHAQGSPHQLAPSAPQLTVPPHTTASLDMTLTVPAASAGNSDAFREVAGIIRFTPASRRRR